MKEVKIKTEFIKLGQFLKLIDIIGTGGEVKAFLEINDVLVNDQKEHRRGRKLKDGDIVFVKGQYFKIIQDGEALDQRI